MKISKLELLILAAFIATRSTAQSVGVGINATGASAHSSAMLDVVSTDRGFLAPRMTTTQRDAISSPATGLLIYQTDGTAGFYYYSGSAWQPISGSSTGTGPWTVAGTDIYNNNTGNVGVGIPAPLARLHAADNVLFSAPGYATPTTPGPVPVSGEGRRTMWYADKAAFRTGGVNGTQWDAANIGNYSFAAGSDNTASGENATAMGSYSTASGYSSVAIGGFSTASGDGSVALGGSANASANNAIALGGANAYGDNSVAIGSSSNAYGTNSLAMAGGYTAASATGGAAIGNSNSSGTLAVALCAASASGQAAMASGTSAAAGNQSTAMGQGSYASGDVSTAIGHYNIASGINSLSTGEFTRASGNRSTAMGCYASTNNRTGAFVIGDYSTAMTLNSSADNQMTMRFAGGYKLFSNFPSTIGVELAPGGNSWSTISDVRKKENFAPVNGEDFLNKISGFKLTSWNYKGQDPKQHRHYGPMAQDFYAAFGKDNYGTVGNDTTISQADMEGVSFVAIQALVKRTEELLDKNEKMQQEIDALKAENKTVTNQNNVLKAELVDQNKTIITRMEMIEAELQKGKISTK